MNTRIKQTKSGKLNQDQSLYDQLCDLMPQFGCHLNAVEENYRICGDTEALDSMREDESSVLFDLLCDFSERELVEHLSWEEQMILFTKIARDYAGSMCEAVQVDDKFTFRGREYKILEVYEVSFGQYGREKWVKATHKNMTGTFRRFRLEDVKDIVRFI